MNGNPAAASHLAEIDARFEAHLAALRERAEHAKETIGQSTSALADSMPKPALDLSRIPVEEPPPYLPPPPAAPLYRDDDAVIPDAPIGAYAAPHVSGPPPPIEEISLDDDGIPLWQD